VVGQGYVLTVAVASCRSLVLPWGRKELRGWLSGWRQLVALTAAALGAGWRGGEGRRRSGCSFVLCVRMIDDEHK